MFPLFPIGLNNIFPKIYIKSQTLCKVVQSSQRNLLERAISIQCDDDDDGGDDDDDDNVVRMLGQRTTRLEEKKNIKMKTFKVHSSLHYLSGTCETASQSVWCVNML